MAVDPFGKRNNLALRREDVNAVGEEVDFDVFEKLCAVRAGTLDFKQVLKPRSCS